jgi:cobalt-zinc-cadmium efflux system outer membrane protein
MFFRLSITLLKNAGERRKHKMHNIKYFTMFRRTFIISALLYLFPLLIFSQKESSTTAIGLSYKNYMQMLVTRNLDYLAEKFNVDIADAGILVAKVFQDPVVSFDRTGSYENKVSQGYSISTEVSKTISPGKRNARIKLATSEGMLAAALVDDYLRNLLADATMDYLTAMKEEYMYRVVLDSYQMMRKLSDADSIRFSLGSIKSIDADQSRIEAGILYNDLLQADASRTSSFLSLSVRTSTVSTDTIFFPTGKFEKIVKSYILNDLISEAMTSRADLRVAKTNILYYRDFLELTKKERRPDIDLRVGAEGSYLNKSQFSPVSHEVYAGISVPLRFSNIYKGDLKIADYQIKQGELLCSQVEIQVKNEVIQAFAMYTSLCRQVENYDKGLLEKASRVLNGKVYSYSRGETSLLEVLNAQRTYNDLQISYIETMYNCFTALVELEKATGKINLEL